MRTLHDPAALAEVRSRLDRLRPDSARQWGTMSAPQAVAHLTVGIEQALGEQRPPRVPIGLLLGWIVKPLALGNDAPLRRNSPTAPEFVITGERDLAVERARLAAALDRFAAAGRAGCTDHPHSFFGRLTPDQWGVLMYKHLDHHLRQFGA